MKNIFTYWKEALKELIYEADGSHVREAEREDQLLLPLLRQRVVITNGKRLLFTSVISVIAGLILAVLTVIFADVANPAPAVLAVIGCGMLAAGGVFFAIPAERELNSKKSGPDKLEKIVIAYWAVFSLGFYLIILGGLMGNGGGAAFYLYMLAITCLPLFNVKFRIIFSISFLIAMVVGCIACGKEPIDILMYALNVVCCCWLSCCIYNSFCCNLIGSRQLSIANERCRQITERDLMTGMLNKKGLYRRMEETLKYAGFQKIALIFIDIDDFKKYNQLYTDKQSDECLYKVCNCIRIISKAKSDIICRFGGDEFVVVMEDASELEVVGFAEQIRASIETLGLPFTKERVVTITVGVSEIHDNTISDYSQMLKEAQDSLQVAKDSGKNCVGYCGRAFHKH